MKQAESFPFVDFLVAAISDNSVYYSASIVLLLLLTAPSHPETSSIYSSFHPETSPIRLQTSNPFNLCSS